MQKMFVLIFYCHFHEILLLLIVKGGAINFDALHQLLYLCHCEFVLALTIRDITWIYIYNDDVIKWEHFPRYWPFVRGIHRSPVNPPHKDQWRGALMFSLTYDWTNSWVNNRGAGGLRRHRTHYDLIVMIFPILI